MDSLKAASIVRFGNSKVTLITSKDEYIKRLSLLLYGKEGVITYKDFTNHITLLSLQVNDRYNSQEWDGKKISNNG